MEDKQIIPEKANLVNRLASATFGVGLISVSLSTSIWIYGLIEYIPKEFIKEDYMGAGVGTMMGIGLVTAGTLGIINGYNLLKKGINGEEVNYR